MLLVPKTLSCLLKNQSSIFNQKKNLISSISYKHFSCKRWLQRDRRAIFYSSFAVGCGLLWGYYISLEKKSTKSQGNLCYIESPFYCQHAQCIESSVSPREKFNFIASVVEDVAPAVVFIEIKSNFNPYFHGQQTISNGSGFVIQQDGLIITNAHVVLGNPNSSVQVKLHDGRVFRGFIESVDMKSDLATVRIDCDGLPTLKLGSSSDVKPGEWVVAVGSPLSLANTITAGVVSSINRGSSELGLQGKDMEYIQTDAAITFGNSGGPLINLNGEVVGVNAMKVTAGISFAIPIDYVKQFLSSSKKKNEEIKHSLYSTKTLNQQLHQRRQYLGVTLLTLTPQLIAELQMRGNDLSANDNNGVLIWKVVLGSPAHNGGLRPGDIIVAVEDCQINTSQDIFNKLDTALKKIKVTVVRKRERINYVINFEEVE